MKLSPDRRRVVRTLLEHGPLTVGEIAARGDMMLPIVRESVAELCPANQTGLVRTVGGDRFAVVEVQP